MTACMLTEQIVPGGGGLDIHLRQVSRLAVSGRMAETATQVLKNLEPFTRIGIEPHTSESCINKIK
jgi:hypothetical protein